jgi:hypothetical protein
MGEKSASRCKMVSIKLASSTGQVSLEFTMLVSILLVLLLATIYYNSSMWMQMIQTENNNDALRVSDQAASEVNLGLKAGDGYVRKFFLPGKISDSLDYNLTVRKYIVYINWTGGSMQSTILTENVTGKFVKGVNRLVNVNGSIYVN